jgi:cytochrome bd-type quinol oxidase subunit 2
MSIEILWFVIVVMMFAVYAVLDGFDFGTGIIYVFVARTDAERQLVFKAIGPVWKGNEVWLVAGGGLLSLAFPKAFAAGFSGIGALTVAMFAVHGANYLALKTETVVRIRASRIANGGTWAVTLLVIMALPALVFVQPALQHRLDEYPVGFVLPLTAAGALLMAWYCRRSRRDGTVFLSWSLFILGSLGSVAWGLFPNLLIATEDPAYSLTINNSTVSSYGLRVGLVWFGLGISLAIGYTIWVYLSFRGKVEQPSIEDDYD